MDKTIANTILQQLGGPMFVALTGAHDMTTDGRSLSIRFKGSKVANHLAITLEPSDTYTVTFSRIGRGGVTVTSEDHDVYADMLRDIFEYHTGLYVSF